jgi:hypothetical protein
MPQGDNERAAEGDYVQLRRSLGRSRNEPTWFKDDDALSAKEIKTTRDNRRAGTGEIKIEVAFTLETGIGPEVGRWSKTRNG